MGGPIRRRIFDHFCLDLVHARNALENVSFEFLKLENFSLHARHLISVNNKLRRMFFARTIKGSKCGDGALVALNQSTREKSKSGSGYYRL